MCEGIGRSNAISFDDFLLSIGSLPVRVAFSAPNARSQIGCATGSTGNLPVRLRQNGCSNDFF
jgi:hypothetical protein